MTNPQESSAAPKWFIILAVILLVWNLLGVIAFFMQITMTAEQIAALPTREQYLYQDIPLWVNFAFGCAVIGGALGCLALAIKKAIAFPILLISLLGVVVQMFHAFFIADAYAVYGPGGAVMPIMVLCVAIFLVWLAKSAKNKGWLS